MLPFRWCHKPLLFYYFGGRGTGGWGVEGAAGGEMELGVVDGWNHKENVGMCQAKLVVPILLSTGQ